jgi:CheY-like chemotaxis protein
VNQRPILIVEDDPIIRQLLLDALELGGYTAIGVTNGLDALSAIHLREPAVVLLDLNLPLLDGEDVLREVHARHPGTHVLLLTADPRGDRLTLADGVTGHVPKPFDLDDLFFALDMVTSQPEPPTPGLPFVSA